MTRKILALGIGLGAFFGALQLIHAQAVNRSNASLVVDARVKPDTLRDALSYTFAAIARASTAPERKTQLSRARQLADAYSIAWQDSFFVRQVIQLESHSAGWTKERVLADSLRLAGIAALGREGVPRAMQLLRESLHHGTAIGNRAAIAPALVAIGGGFFRAGQLDSAMAYLEKGKTLATRIGDNRTLGNALGVLGSVAKNRGDTSRAVMLYGAASAMRTRSGDTRGLAADENNLGLIARERGDSREATREFNRALAHNRRDKRQSLVALNLANLAGVASDASDYAQADSLFRLALSIQRSGTDRAETAFMLHDFGRLQIRRGDYGDANASLTEALRIDQQSGAIEEVISVQTDLAALQSAIGRPEEALRTLEGAERQAVAASASVEQRAGLALSRSDLALEFGAFAQAEPGYLRAERLYAEAGNASGRADARYGRALLLYLRGENDRSLQLLEESRHAQLAAGDRRSAALTQLLIARVEHARGNSAAARRALAAAQQSLHAIGDAAGEAAALELMGTLSLREGSILSAEQLYRRGLTRLGKRPAVDVRWRLHAGVAQALRERGALDEAAGEYRTAIAIAEKTARHIHLEERRYGFLADKWSTYTQLAQLEQKRGHPAEAFAISERLRARQLLDMLARGRIDAPHVSTVQEQDFRRRVAEITQRLEPNRSSGELRGPSVPAQSERTALAQLDGAQRAYALLLAKVSERDPGYARLVSAVTLSSRDVSSKLKPGEVLLEYLLGDSTCTVFVITADTLAALSLPIDHESLAAAVDFSRRAIERPNDLTANALWRPPLRRLYRDLIQPVEQKGYLRGKRRLVIVPHGELHFLSFAALITPGAKDRFLIDRFEIVYAPSATAWVNLGARESKSSNSPVLALAPYVDRLPASRREVRAIGEIYRSRATVRIGVQASEHTLRAALPTAGTVHLATFGVLNRHNPLFSYVSLAPGSGSDGRLEVNKVFGLGLSGQLVVLSACQTALGAGANEDVPPGDDWVGLVQAFLQGGASRVLASLWPVEDGATALLMQRFYRRLATGRPAVTALAQAQREMLSRPETAPPFFWAGFVMNGNSVER